VNHLEHCDALEIEVERFATVLAAGPLDSPVTGCPGWDVRDVAVHVGKVHRWATELVRREARERMTMTELGVETGDGSPQWIREGGARLVETLRHANPDDAMWAMTSDQHVRYWSRRQLHETLVHRMDIELAAGIEPGGAPDVAVDAIDEILEKLSDAGRFTFVTGPPGGSERLGIRELDSGTCWTVTIHGEGFDAVARTSMPKSVDVRTSCCSRSTVVAILASATSRSPATSESPVTGWRTRHLSSAVRKYGRIGPRSMQN
jgi:uncharacterized protein (TIGR03083 family)